MMRTLEALSFGTVITLFTGIIFTLSLWIYGVYLAFSSSIIIGLISLIPPCDVVYGICGLFGKNVPAAIQAWIHFPI